MKKEEKELLDRSSNPFVQSLKIKTRSITTVKKVVDISKIDNGIITSLPDSLTSEITVDDEKFTKLFNRAGFRIHISCLSWKAKGLLLWLLYELEEGKDWIWLNRKRFKEENGGTWTDIVNSLIELSESNIITPTVIKDCYWINPLFFFNGNRLKKYPENTT